MISYRRFEYALYIAADKIVRPNSLVDDPAIEKALENTVLGFANRYRTSQEVPPPTEYIPFMRIFYSFVEVHDAHLTLKAIPRYVKELKPFARGYSTVMRFRFYCSSFLSEVYIFRDRLIRMLKEVKSALSEDSRDPDASQRLSQIDEMVRRELSLLSELRNEQVHNERITSPEWHRLAALEVIAREQKEPATSEWKRRYRREFLAMREDWTRSFAQHLTAIEAVTGSYFLLLYPVLFDEQACLLLKIREPTATTARTPAEPRSRSTLAQ